jgi:Glutaredoxin-like domain (DUF836)
VQPTYCEVMSSRPDDVPGRITLVGRPGCHLCDDAREVVRRVADDTGAGWAELSVDDDPELLAQYADQVPVVLVDGAQHDFWRVDEQRLRRALAGGRRHRWGRAAR